MQCYQPSFLPRLHHLEEIFSLGFQQHCDGRLVEELKQKGTFTSSKFFRRPGLDVACPIQDVEAAQVRPHHQVLAYGLCSLCRGFLSLSDPLLLVRSSFSLHLAAYVALSCFAFRFILSDNETEKLCSKESRMAHYFRLLHTVAVKLQGAPKVGP